MPFYRGEEAHCLLVIIAITENGRRFAVATACGLMENVSRRSVVSAIGDLWFGLVIQ